MKRIFLLSVLIIIGLALHADEKKDSAQYTSHVSLFMNAQLGSYHVQIQGQFARKFKLDALPIFSAAMEFTGKKGGLWKLQYTINRYYRFWEQENYVLKFDENISFDGLIRFHSQLGVLRGSSLFPHSKLLHMKLYVGIGGFLILDSELPDYFHSIYPEKIGDEVEINETKGTLSQEGIIRKVTPYISLQATKEFELADGIDFFIGYQINYTPINMAEKSYWLQVGNEKKYWSQEQYKPNQWGLMLGIKGHLFNLTKSG